MDIKKIRAGAGRLAGRFGLVSCSLIIKVLPARSLYGFARFIGALGYLCLLKQRRIALDSLAVAFGKDKTEKEIIAIARACFNNLAKSAVELLFLLDRPQILKSRVALEGVEHLGEALSAGKGVILVSAHFGNFPLMMAKLAREGYPIAGIMRPMRDERVEKIFQEKRLRLNIRTIYSQPRAACVSMTIAALRENGVVFIPLDQNFGTAGIFVDFFGRKAATATGPVVLAQRTDAALVPAFIVRLPDDTHKIIFEPRLRLTQEATPRETIAVNIQRLTAIIETYIRRYPHEWGWIHRRWKSRVSRDVSGAW